MTARPADIDANEAPSYLRRTPSGLRPGRPLSFEARLVVEQAEAHGVAWRVVPGGRAIELTWRDRRQLLVHRIPPATTAAAFHIVKRKHRAHECMLRAGLEVCPGFHLTRDSSADERRRVFETLEAPLVVKPDVGGGAGNIFLGVRDRESYDRATRELLDGPDSARFGAFVQSMFEGAREFRIVATRDRVLAASRIRSPVVVGDGASSIEGLIRRENANPLRRAQEAGPLSLIEIDDALAGHLASKGLDLGSIPEPGREIELRPIPNLGSGGTGVDCTEQVHPGAAEIALRAVRSIPGLALGGIDFMCRDIESEQRKGEYAVIEINASPRFGAHVAADGTGAESLARELLAQAFPELEETWK